MSGENVPEIEVTPDMIKAGVAVLADLEGEASKAFVAEAVYLAMQAARLGN